MAQSQTIAVGIAGVTGKFAGLLLDSLLEHPNVQVRGLCRNASRLASRYTDSKQVEVIQGDIFDPTTLNNFANGLDVVICAYLGDNDLMINAQKALIDACDQAHVPRYVASDYTFDYTKLELGQHPVKDSMKIVHAYLKDKKHVQGVHILNGAFLETFWSAYFQVWNSAEKALVFWGDGNEKLEVTTYGDSAKYTAAVALDSSAVGFKKFLGDRISINEIAKALKDAYGFEPKLQRQGSLDELYNEMQSRFAKKPANIYAWLALFYQYYCTNGQTYIADDLDSGNYPHVKPQSMRDFLATHALEELSGAMEDLGRRE